MFKTRTTILFLFVVIVPNSLKGFLTEANSNGNGVKEKVFLQRLDHFSPIDNRLWNQRYLINDEFYERNISKNSFLYIGGESKGKEKHIQEGMAYEAAKKYGGILFLLEHRFYGKSQPFENLSISNLRYLNSLQAVYDLATFVTEMNEIYDFGEDMKWISVGGSYAGSLSAWLRLKFPHLIYAAVASSAPLHAKLEFPEYLEIVSNDIAVHGDGCVKNVNTAFEQLENVLQNKTRDNITEMFNLCEEPQLPMTKEMDKYYLFEYLIDYVFAVTAQSHNPNTTMKEVCEIMNNTTIATQIERLGRVSRLVNGENCVATEWAVASAEWKNETISEDNMYRQWWYQTCTEFGWYQTTTSSNPAFGNRVPLEYFLNLCMDLFGEDYNKSFIENQIKGTNINYGSIGIEASRIIFVHGSLDPWHAVGLYKLPTNKWYSVWFIEGATHCSDLHNASEKDPPSLTYAREEILQSIGEWLRSSSSTRHRGKFEVVLAISVYFLFIIS